MDKPAPANGEYVPDSDPILDVHGLGRLLKISPRTVWRKLSTGGVPAPFHIGRQRRWSRAAVDRWVADRAAKAMQEGN